MGEEDGVGLTSPAKMNGEHAEEPAAEVAGVQRTLSHTDTDDDDTKVLLDGAKISRSKTEPSQNQQNGGWHSQVNPHQKKATMLSLLHAFSADAKTSTWHMFLGTKMNVLLVCIPFAIVSHKCSWGSGLTAVLSLLSLCPLAERLGFTTEQLALRTNDTLGALLNVTFGNATELILSVVALKESELLLIQLSLIGSILSNQLLVLGSSMVIGGLKHGTQLFERQSALLHVSLLVGSSLALLIPMLIKFVDKDSSSEHTITWLSRIISFLMIGVYCLFLYHILKLEKSKTKEQGVPANTPEKFSILNKSHLSILNHSVTRHSLDIEMGGINTHKSAMNMGDFDLSARSAESEVQLLEDEEEEEEPVISTCSGVFWLGVVAVLISYMSDILVANIEAGAAEQLHIPSGFLYTIIVPIVGNAAEHTSALIFSYRNKPDIAFGIAVGSSVQIALLVIPACVLIAWPMKKLLTLDFHAFETSVYAASVVLLLTVVNDGRSNWMKGALLIAAYFMISVGVWFV